LRRGVLLGRLLWIIGSTAQPDMAGQSLDATDNIAAPANRSISLAQAQDLALRHNWDLLAAAASIDAATAQKIVAHEFPNPTLSLSVSKIEVDNHSSTSMGNAFWDRSYDSIAAVNQLLEIGGKRRHRQASAQAGYDAARAAFYDAKRTLDLGVAKTYIAAVLAQENFRVLTNSAASMQQEARLAKVRFEAGEISASDRSQIEIAAGRLSLDAQAAEATAAQARVALELLLGEKSSKGDVVLTDELTSLVKVDLESSLFDPARRPDVIAAQASLRKAESDVRLAKANRVPDPTVLLQYEHEPPDTPNSIGLGVSLPIPLWNRNRGNILGAEAARQQALLTYQKLEAQANAEAASARIAYEDAARRWNQYGQQIVPKSQEVRKTIAYAYEKGGASLLDLLVAERNDNEVRLAMAQAASDTASALAALKAARTQMQPSGEQK